MNLKLTATLIAFSATTFALALPPSRPQNDSETLYCASTNSHLGNTRSDGSVDKVKDKSMQEHNEKKHKHFIDRDGAPDGFKGMAYTSNCRHGGFTSPNSKPQESRQNRSKE
jgi:hypothetical protein